MILIAVKYFGETFRLVRQPAPPVDVYALKKHLSSTAYEVLFDYGILTKWISGDSARKVIRIPKDLAIVEPYCALLEAFQKSGGQVLTAASNPNGDEVRIEVGKHGVPFFELDLKKDQKIERTVGRLGVVLVDLGESWSSTVEELLEIDAKLTVSILPGFENSRRIAARAHEGRHEIFSQSDWRAANGKNEDRFVIASGLSEDEVRSRAGATMAAMPNVQGICLVVPASAGAQSEALAASLQSILDAAPSVLLIGRGDNGLYGQVASRARGAFVIADLWLDEIKEEPFISRQLLALAELSIRDGKAIGVFRASGAALQAVQKTVPRLKKKGFRFVAVSDLLK